MSSFAAAYGLSARLARRKLSRDAVSRGFHASALRPAAQNFTMPALSPTMTEGNIASWRVKEGDKFAAGDVLLEIETDKATMDVEAQDDGVLMKITQGDGSKSVKVGTRIAVLAEEGDDVASLEMPPDEKQEQQQQKESEQQSSGSTASPTPPQQQSGAEQPASQPPPTDSARKPGAKPAKKQTYPLLPSVAHLVKEHGLDEAAMADMTPTGPNGRLLKGDVLAYLGSINSATPAAVEQRFEQLSHLDLSNIKVAAPKQKAADAKASDKKSGAAAQEESAVVTLPVSLAAVLAVQKKMHDTLGVFMPLSTFIARATEVANDELPLPRGGATPSADELFDQILGLDKVGGGSSRHGSRGFYMPQISALTPPPAATTSLGGGLRPAVARRADIIDVLAGPAAASRRSTKPVRVAAPGMSTGVNAFSLAVPKAEERRAKVFLERVKLVLENEPGRLVL